MVAEVLGFALNLRAPSLASTAWFKPSLHPPTQCSGPAGVFIHNDDLVFLHNIFHVLLIKTVRLEQLQDGVDFLGPRFKILFLCDWSSALSSDLCAPCINLVQQRRQIRQHKSFRVLGANETLQPFTVRSASWLFSSMANSNSLFPGKGPPSSGPGQIQFGPIHQPRFRVFQKVSTTPRILAGRF